MEKHYDRQEAEEILRRALVRSNDDSVSHEDLIAAAAEVGVDPESLERAALELQQDRLRKGHRERLLARRRARFVRHFMSYVGVNLALTVIDVATGPGAWAYFVACGWGIGIFFQAMHTFFPSESALERRVDRAIRRESALADRQRQASGRPRARPGKRAATIQQIMDSGVDLVLEQVADQLDRQRRKGDTRVRVESPDPAEGTQHPDAQRQRHHRR